MIKGRKGLVIGLSILVVTAVLGSFASIAFAQPTATSFGVEDAEGYPDTHVLIPVNITNVQNGPVPTIIFNILYNNSVINVTEVQKGTLTSNWDNPNYCNHDWGTSVVIYTSTDAYAVQNGLTGSVALLNFSVIGEAGATSVMDLSNIQLAEGAPDFQVGTAPANNGTFTVLHDDLNVVSCLGDSITNGYPYAGTENTYPARLQAILDTAYGSGSYEVINHGVDGYRADQVLADLQNLNWLAQDNPDVVLLMVGGNDLSQEATPLNLFTVINQTVAEVQDIVDLVTTHTNPDGSHPRIIVSAFTPVQDTLECTAVKLYNNRQESDLTGMDLWFTDNWDDFYNPDTGHARASLMADNVHPNADGYAIMAENWFEACDSIMDVIYVSPESYIVRSFTDKEGRQIDQILVPGRPPKIKAPTVAVPVSDIAKGVNVLPNVPAFDWCYGCSATSAAMMFGYYDNFGYPNMYAGPANGGVCPLTNSVWGYKECPLSATHKGYDGLTTKGHVDDYWYSYGSNSDPYYGNWAEQGYADCTADYMGTNQYHNWQMPDGGTYFYFSTSPLYDYTGGEPTYRDGCHGMRLFVESRGYTVHHDGYNYQNYNQYIQEYKPGGFTFEQFQAEIDAGRPVIILVTGHSMLGYGYNTAGNIVYIHDTWDHSEHQMTWGGSYSGRQHLGVTVIQLEQLDSSSWTFMVYLGADNNLEGAGIDDFMEMSSVSTTSTVNISVQFDRIPGYDSSYGDWTGCKRFLVTPGMTPTAANAIADLGECNMGDPDTLTEFVNWTMTNYPADNYALILWNHGSGWKKGVPWGDITGSGRGICWDVTNNSDYLTLQETEQALTGKYVDLLGYDACLMHMIEVVYQVRANAGISVGSEESEPGDGWPYDMILGDLTGTPVMTSRSLGTTIVQRYIASYAPATDETQSAVDNADLPGLVTAVDNFAQVLINEINAGNRAQVQQARTAAESSYWDDDYIDLYHFAELIQTYVPGAATHAQAVMDNASTAVYAEMHGSSHTNFHGLAIYFPKAEGDYLASYGNTKFANDTNWDEFLNRYYIDMEVNKTVQDLKTGEWKKVILANVSDEVRFRIWVHNNGTGNLTNITVNDTLSAGLDYTVGTATPFEPNTTVDNPDGSTTLYWNLSGPLEYCENVTIEYNASKIKRGKDWNCVNVSAWYNETTPHVQVFDEDCAYVHGKRDDTAIFQSGTWYVDYDGDQQWDDTFLFGVYPGDVPVIGDINQDGRDDTAIFRSGTWYVDYDGDQQWDDTFLFGVYPGDVPVIGDINQDGRDDTAIFRSGTWYVDYDGDQHWDDTFLFGVYPGDVPVIGDINQDGRDDTAIFRSGTWYVDYDGDQHWDDTFLFGVYLGDVPVIGDINQDGRDDTAIFRSGTWYVDYDGDQHWDDTFLFGVYPGDVPVVGDINVFAIEANKTVWDPKTGDWVDVIKANVSDAVRFKIWIHNNGTDFDLTNITVNDTLSESLEYAGNATVNSEVCEPEVVSGQQLVWYYNASKLCTNPFKNLSCCQNITIEFNATKNLTGDDTNCVNVSAWYNETGSHVQIFDEDCAGVRGKRDDTAIFRSGTWYVDWDGDQQWDDTFLFGTYPGDIPVIGDINQDGNDDTAIFRSGTWYVDWDGDQQWDDTFLFGVYAGDVPVIGDINQDGNDDTAIFRSGTWYVDYDGDQQWDDTFLFGVYAGDVPVVGDINQDGKDDTAIFRSGTWYVDYDGDQHWDDTFLFGVYAGDVPVVGDINQDGKDDTAVFRSGTWYVDYDGDQHWDDTFLFGTYPGDVPVIGDIK